MNTKQNVLGFLLAMAFFFVTVPLYGLGTDEKEGDMHAVNHPVYDVIFVIDNSGSMKKNDPEFITKNFVKNFADQVPEGTRFGMVLFDQDVRLVKPLGPQTTSESSADLMQSLANVNYRGQFTNSPDGIERAIYELKTHGRNDSEKAIIFITDGFVDTGDKQLDMVKDRWLREDLALASKNAGIRIFGIAFSENADVQLIQTLALKTGGEYFRTLLASDIYAVLDNIIQIISTYPEPEPPVQQASPALVIQEKQTETPSIPVTAPAPAPEAYHSPTPDISKMFYISFIAVVSLCLLGIVIYFKFFRGPSPSQAHTGPASISHYLKGEQTKPEAKLIDIQNVSAKGTFPLNLNKNRISIGRDSKNDIVIPHKTISGFHAIIEFKDEYYFLEDHRSTNGTSLNGKRLVRNQSVKLKSGDRIDFSSFEFRFLLLDQDPTGKTVILGSSSMFSEGMGKEKKEKRKAGDDFQLFQGCLEKHLGRISECGTQYKTYISETFSDDVINTLSNKITEAMVRSGGKGDGQLTVIPKFPTLFQLCILPIGIEDAAGWFEQKYGGYIKFLNQSFKAKYFSEQGYTGLCIVVYGRTDDAWVSITIAPVKEGEEQVEIMSYEFLSEEEKRNLALNFDEIGRII